MPLTIYEEDFAVESPEPDRPPRYRISLGQPSHRQAIKAMVKARRDWMRHHGLATDPVEPPVLSHLGSGAPAGAQVWVLHEESMLRGAAVTSIAPTVNLQWHQDPDSESLWLHDMYTDPDTHDAPGRWLTWWLSQHYASCLTYVFTALCDEVLARKFATVHVMELHPTQDEFRPFLLRRRTGPARRRLHTYVASDVPPPDAATRLRP
ncbi:hypothetical protein ADK70_38475 [Streptomyces rimosus subsp. pseudoverticillatus]|uniref:hypothetical protein n=1 Tax=Streptomyces rimosus TaxID=1927 RepID=UPI0006B28B7D|nr:hypothetical protein [Streptomyces rimosus]KOT76370.1 hypothetical protein ADK70_38475 [Streptomyces rimosus subsp. pseudoverticillatus]